ncbi:HlyD family secretion protein [Cupriavidus agavae]|uniref:Membrane fusion protein (Multidrug efflux system) n=1 Tax=Cupriavidus agavae TaxID=1001822 RepID=A0A4Q7RZM9_9BURK|nr:efflux RND transporter periplasmic adaptor subunit [Cupriavidus agavae]RZT39334.1 membrane fusion protein (multidrug efflux system) [Cupriavidus agavae]
MQPSSQPPVAADPTTKHGPRRRMLALLALAVAGTGMAAGAWYWLVGRYHQTTDDAYVNGNVVQITPQVTGTVIAVRADDTQTVHEGQPLVELDAADARVTLQRAEAKLAQTVRQVKGLFVDDAQYAAQVAVREADFARAQEDLRRRLSVSQTGSVSQEDVSHAHDAVRSAQAALDAARQQLAANRALTINTTIATHPDVQEAAAQVRDAYLANARNLLPAPVNGYVAERSVQVGQRVSPGTPLMAVVPLQDVWVDANFKEVELAHLRVGQPVTLTADAYGSSVVYHGRVAGFSAGTGSAFSLLPAQNATGNWIKVVQRVPVRIALDPRELTAHPLRIGLSMQADVDIHDQTGGALAKAQQATAYQTDVFARYGDQADAEIARIVAANAGLGTAQGTAQGDAHLAMRRKASAT